MTPLALTGSAIAVDGAAQSNRRMLLRLRAPHSIPPELDERDGVLIRDQEDLATGKERGFKTAVFLDNPLSPGGCEGFDVTVRLGPRFAHLGDGDIIGLEPASRRLRVLYRRASKHNAFLVTERCNHYCLMCSQPPRNVEDSWILDEIEECIELIDPSTETIGFTGGEPLLQWQRLIALLAVVRDRLPETAIHVLTNGRAFGADEVTAAWAAIGHRRLTVGIPLYSAVDTVHDYVVQARGAFDETVLGILRLKDKGQRVEVRVVLHAITAPRLRETCAWLARNLPFVDHVALMAWKTRASRWPIRICCGSTRLITRPISPAACICCAPPGSTPRSIICRFVYWTARCGTLGSSRYRTGKTATCPNATAAPRGRGAPGSFRPDDHGLAAG